MGCKLRPEEYATFIAAGQETDRVNEKRLTFIRTSCAMFVRAVLIWCGHPMRGAYLPGSGMFKSMGGVSWSHPAACFEGEPRPGDIFYVASSRQSLDGHTGIVLAKNEDGTFQTAEGGGGDGTKCALSVRDFSKGNRPLQVWFDVEKMGLPEFDGLSEDDKANALTLKMHGGFGEDVTQVKA